MKKIQVKIIDHNFDGMPIFLAKMTQRGHLINSMDDLMKLHDDVVDKKPSDKLLSLPHTTIQRMNYMTVAITGLSTKAVSQLRTHAKRLTFLSTSTQYSSFEGRNDNYVIPQGLTKEQEDLMKTGYEKIHNIYADLIRAGADKDKVGYLLPQGLRKALVISGNLDDWKYVLKTRLCHRNTEEVQTIAKMILHEIKHECGEEFTVDMYPSCVNGECKEGKFCCGKRFEK